MKFKFEDEEKNLHEVKIKITNTPSVFMEGPWFVLRNEEYVDKAIQAILWPNEQSDSGEEEKEDEENQSPSIAKVEGIVLDQNH